MPLLDIRALRPGKVCQLLNSFKEAGAVLTVSRLAKHRQQAGAGICGRDAETGLPDFGAVNLWKYCAWLLQRRHAAPSLPAGDDAGAAAKPALGPRFSGEGPRFG